MEALQKLKDAFSNIASDILSGIDWNSSSPSVVIGTCSHFRVFAGVEKATKNPVSVWVVPLSLLSQRCSSPAEAEWVLRKIKSGIQLLTKLRHPFVLKVVTPLVEDKKRLYFASEPVHGTPASILAEEKWKDVSDVPLVERLFGLHCCGEALQFLHERANLAFGCFNPGALVVCDGENGRCWKLADFSFATSFSDVSRSVQWDFPPFSSAHQLNWPTSIFPPLEYLAYEIVDAIRLRASTQTTFKFTGQDADSFSVLISTINLLAPKLFPGGDSFPLFNCGGNPEVHLRQRERVEKVVDSVFPSFPGALRVPVSMASDLLSFDDKKGGRRPSISEVLNSEVFRDPQLQLIISLRPTAFATLEHRERMQLLKKLHGGVAEMPSSVVAHRVVPFLLSDQTRGLISLDASDSHSMQYIFPILCECCRSLDSPTLNKTIRPFFNSFIVTNIIARLKLFHLTPTGWKQTGDVCSFEPHAIVLLHVALEKFDTLSHALDSPNEIKTLIAPLILSGLHLPFRFDHASNLWEEVKAPEQVDGKVEKIVAVALHKLTLTCSPKSKTPLDLLHPELMCTSLLHAVCYLCKRNHHEFCEAGAPLFQQFLVYFSKEYRWNMLEPLIIKVLGTSTCSKMHQHLLPVLVGLVTPAREDVCADQCEHICKSTIPLVCPLLTSEHCSWQRKQIASLIKELVDVVQKHLEARTQRTNAMMANASPANSDVPSSSTNEVALSSRLPPPATELSFFVSEQKQAHHHVSSSSVQQKDDVRDVFGI